MIIHVDMVFCHRYYFEQYQADKQRLVSTSPMATMYMYVHGLYERTVFRILMLHGVYRVCDPSTTASRVVPACPKCLVVHVDMVLRGVETRGALGDDRSLNL